MDNIAKEYKFKYVHHIMRAVYGAGLGIFAWLYILAQITERLERSQSLILNYVSIWIIFTIGLLLGALLIVILSYSLAEAHGKCTLGKNRVELELKNKKYSLSYYEIRRVGMVNSWKIYLGNNSISIMPSFRFIFNDPLAKCMKELEKRTR